MKITDEMLFEHAAEARDIWLGTLPEENDIPEIQCSKSFDRKMQKLIREQRRTPKANQILHFMQQTVVAVLVVAVVSFGGLMTVGAYREKVIEIVIHVFHEFTEYRFASDSSNAAEIVLPELSFQYIPEGMQKVEDKVTQSNRRYILYKDTTGHFFELTQRTIGSDGSYGTILDTEDSEYENITINGNEAFCNEKDGDCIIVWTDKNIVYRLYGTIERNELKSIVENIKIFEE